MVGDRDVAWDSICAPGLLGAAPAHLFVILHPQSGAMEGEPLQTFYNQLVLMPSVLHYAQYVLLALGCVLLLIPIIHQIRSQVGDGQSEAWAEQPMACLLGEGGAWGPLGIPPVASADTLSPEPTLGSGPGVSAWGRGAITACLSLLPPALQLLCGSWEAWGPSLGGAAGRALGNEAWYLNALFIKSVSAGCQSLPGAGQLAVNKTDPCPALGEHGVLVMGTDENRRNRKGNFADDK